MLGGPVVVDRYIRGLGVQGIAVVDTEKTLGKDVTAQYRDNCTPAAMVRLLRLLADDRALTGTSGEDNGITHATNDVGLITMRNGKKLAIAVMIRDSPASEEVRERVIAQITKAVWSEADGKLAF